MKKANHQTNIVRITNIKKHPNADNLDIITLGEYQVVSRTGQFTIGELGVYIQPDSVVPQTEPFKFIWEPYLSQFTATETCNGTTVVHCIPDFSSQVPERRRRIAVRRFRGEWSEGLLLSVNDFIELIIDPNGKVSQTYPEVGTDVSELLGITHYDPDAGKESTKGDNQFGPKVRKKYPHSLKGWIKYIIRRVKHLLHIYDPVGGIDDAISLGIPVYDVESMKNHKDVFQKDEFVVVTEKIHGSNARYVFTDGVMYAGSRTLWKAPNSNDVWRNALKENPWIEEWCRAHPDYVLWGEVTPTQKGFNYGSDRIQFFVFDIYTPDRKWLEDNMETEALWRPLDNRRVPIIYIGPYIEETIKSFVDGHSTVTNAKHIREGIVIKSAKERHVHGLGRAQVKLVSNAFLERDSK